MQKVLVKATQQIRYLSEQKKTPLYKSTFDCPIYKILINYETFKWFDY